MNARALAFIAVLIFGCLVWLYVREFAVFSNTIEVKNLVIGSMTVMAILVAGLLWRWRSRFMPWNRHVPEFLLILIFSLLFAPLFGSLLNRSLGTEETQSFDFISETAYFASGYGVLKGERLRPTGWRLTVREEGVERRFKYKNQAYFPLTKPGEKVLLPMCKGVFGPRVMRLK